MASAAATAQFPGHPSGPAIWVAPVGKSPGQLRPVQPLTPPTVLPALSVDLSSPPSSSFCCPCHHTQIPLTHGDKLERDQGCNTTSLQLNLEVLCSKSTPCPLAAHSGLAWGSALPLFPKLIPLFRKHCESTCHAWGLPLVFWRFLSRVRLYPPGVESRGTEHINEVTSKLTTRHIRI